MLPARASTLGSSSDNLTSSSFDSSPYSGAAAALRFDSASSMELTVVIFLLLVFFLGFFSIFAHRFFGGPRRGPPTPNTTVLVPRRRPPTPPSRLSAPASTDHFRRYFSPTLGTAGLDPLAVRALPVLTYARGGAAKLQAAAAAGCVVCLGEFVEEKERVKMIPGCGHVFHPACIDGWLVLHGSCPICRCSDLFGVGTVGSRGEIRVDLHAGGSHEEEESTDGEEEEEEKLELLEGLGIRSRSFSDEGGAAEGGVFLRRTCSV